ncbi:ras GEF, partial [Auriscalpium vulgare]
QSQCRDLAKRCQALRLALRDNSVGLEGTHEQKVVDEVDSLIERVYERVRQWAVYPKLKSMVKQNEIKLGIEESYRELDSVSMQFNVQSSHLLAIAFHIRSLVHSRDMEELRAHDHADLIEMVAQSLQNFNQLKDVLATENTHQDVQSVMRTIQEELQDSNLEETQEQQFQQGLWELHRWTHQLPPGVDLTGQVQRTSDYAAIVGGSQDIFQGEWLEAEERFSQQVEIWRRLQHPNVLRLYGIAYIEDYVYSVSPWMRNGNAMAYLSEHPEIDRTRLLSEIFRTACSCYIAGMEYLHTNNIVHGDLRGTNILISDTGKACICDFGLSQYESDNPGALSPTSANSRWLAPEIFTPEQFVPPTKAGDVWSFGMTCIEVFTGAPPYAKFARDMAVAVRIASGDLPERPDPAIAHGLSDAMWELMLRCWQRMPEARPTMPEIRATMKLMLPEKSPRLASVALPPRSSSSVANPAGHVRASRSYSSNSSETPSRPSISGLSMTRPPQLLERETLLARTPSSAGSSSHWQDTDAPPPSSRSWLTPTNAGPTTPSNPVNPIPPSPVHRIIHGKSMSASPPKGPSSYFGRTVSSSPPSQPTLKLPPSPTPRISTSSPSHPALRDPEPLLKRAADGTVEAGTLHGLAKRLTMNTTEQTKDVDFRFVFLTTYRFFTTSEDLFAVLRRRFEEASEGLTITAVPGSGVRYPIMLFLKTWLKMDYEDLDERVLLLIQDFARSIRGSQTMEAQAKDIVDIVNDQVRMPQICFSVDLLTASARCAVDLATALTVVEGDCYAKITYLDVVLHLLHSNNKHIEAASVMNNRIVNWVKKRVLKSNDVSRRAEVFKFFVNAAEECRKLGNFSSMSAIVTALQSSTKADSTTPLMLTRTQKLSSSEKRTLRHLDDLLAPSSNHRAYREALRDASTSRIVPWLAAHLHYLTTIYHRLPPALDIDGHGMINFQRYTVLVAQIRAVLEYKAPELVAARGSGVLAYLQHELDVTPPRGVHEHFEKRSAALAQMEKTLHDQHMAELLALGFPPPRPSAPSARPSTADGAPPSAGGSSKASRKDSVRTTGSQEKGKEKEKRHWRLF